MIGGDRLVAALDVGSTKTCAVIAECAPDSGHPSAIQVLGVGLAPSEGVRKEGVTNIEATTESVGQALREAELMAGEEVESAFVGVAGPHVRSESSSGVVAISSDEVSRADVDRVHEVARAVVVAPDRELLHAIPQNYSVDGRAGIQDPVGMAGTRLETEVCIITADATPCRNLRKALDRAGYYAEEVVLESLASSIAVLQEREREAGVALVEVGGASTELAVFMDGRIRRLATLPWGALTVTNDIVKGLGVPQDEAVALKEEHGAARTELVGSDQKIEVQGPTPGSTRTVSRELLVHIIEQRLDETLGLAYDELHDAGMLGDLGAGVVLTGGGVMLPGAVELAQGVFNLPVRLGEPGQGLGGVADAVRKPKFATGVGLAMYGAQRRRQSGGGAARRTLGRVAEWIKDFF